MSLFGPKPQKQTDLIFSRYNLEFGNGLATRRCKNQIYSPAKVKLSIGNLKILSIRNIFNKQWVCFSPGIFMACIKWLKAYQKIATPFTND